MFIKNYNPGVNIFVFTGFPFLQGFLYTVEVHFYGLSICVPPPWLSEIHECTGSLRPYQHWGFYWKTMFINFAVGKWCPIIALICISLITNDVNIFP